MNNRTYARTLTMDKGLTCVNCGQKAIEMHNIDDCVKALEDQALKLMRSEEYNGGYEHSSTECDDHRNCYVGV